MARHHKSMKKSDGYQARGRHMDTSRPMPNVVSEMRHQEHYAGHDQRGYQATKQAMHRDGVMINDDWSAPALLPRHVIESYYPAGGYHIGGAPDNLYTGAENQLSEDGHDMRMENKPKKY